MAILKLQCCGVLQQACGGVDHELEISGFPVRVDEALARFGTHHSTAQKYFPYVACAVGDEIVHRDHALKAGETLVLLPPVSGG